MVHSIDSSVRQLARTGSSIGLSAQICEWQFMQVWVGGKPAYAERLDRGVAVAAVDAELAGVVLVAERHRLLARRLLACVT